jgi:hypothetical protein
LKQIGLLDDKGKATWLDDQGHGDLLKMLSIASPKLAGLSTEERVRAEKLLFGAQGSGAISVLSEPVVQEQLKAISADVKSPESVNRMKNFLGEYNQDSSLQSARTTFQTFNVLMADIGEKILPAVNVALREFKGGLEGLDAFVNKILPNRSPQQQQVDKWNMGGRAIEGMAGGAIYGGLTAGPLGAVAGGLGGAALGAATALPNRSAKPSSSG